jgi:hypothetical protein
VNDVPFSGRAWHGIDKSGDGDSLQRVVPVLDGAADDLAMRLGFAARSKEQIGTSVLVIDTALSEDEIVAGVEDWWWPRLVEGSIDVEVINAKGDKLVPRPRKRDHLRPFIDAFDIASGTAEPKQGSTKKKQFNKIHNLSMGTCALKVIEKTAEDNYSVGEERIDCVALIRELKMVVQYYKRWQVGSPAIAGVYLADEEIDDILKLSEPPSHSVWDPNSARLRDAKGVNKEIVETILKRIKTEVKAFQKAASPPPPPKMRRLTLLECALAKMLAPSKKGPDPGPDKATAPIHLQYEDEPHALDAGAGALKTRATFSVRLKPDVDDDQVKIRVKIDCAVLADGDEKGDEITVSTSVKGVVAKPAADDPSAFDFPLQKGDVARFFSETEPYDATWSINFVPLGACLLYLGVAAV